MFIILRKIKSMFRHIFDYIYSIFFNFKVFPFKTAIKLPVKMTHSVKMIKCYKGCIEIKAPIKHYMIKFGEIGAPFVREEKSSFFCSNKGKIVFYGKTIFAKGFKLFITDGAELVIGKDSYLGCNTVIQCEEKIIIGNNFLGGWNVNIRDTDGHTVIVNGEKKPMSKPIKIGQHVWVGADCTILKGSEINNDSIIGSNSLIVGIKSEKKGCLIAGTPAKIKKEDIEWSK